MSRGINRERQVRVLLEDAGWWVTRAAGSKGDADLVALKAGRTPHLIEVKSTTRGPFHDFRPADRADLSAAAAHAGAEAWLCWWPPRKKARWFAEHEWPKTRPGAA